MNLVLQWLISVSTGGFNAASAAYSKLVNAMGDATKVVFGFCTGDCSSFDVDGNQAAAIMNDVTSAYPCNGGAFFWVAHNDAGGSFSDPLYTTISQTAGCSSTITPR